MASGTLGSTIDAVTRVLGTAREARRFVEALAEQLGDRALLDTADGGRVLLVRDRACPELLAWPPLAALQPTDRRAVVSGVRVPGAALPERVSRAALEVTFQARPSPPEGGPCSLRLAEGRDHLELAYDDVGALTSARPGPSRRLGPVEPAASGDPRDAAALASALAADVDAHLGSLRVRLADPSAAAALEVAIAAVPALRRELFQPSTREGAGIAVVTVADGWVGVTTAFDDALRALDRSAVAALASFGALPTRIPGRFWEAGFHRWARVLGDAGDVGHALLREDDAVVTMIGEAILDRVDPWRLDAELDAADRDTRGLLAAIPDARPTAESSTLTSYRVVDDAHRRRVPTQLAMSQAGPGLPPWQLPAPDDLPWQVARWRRSAHRR